jgi:AcrR family transcriptional regulator
MGKAFSLEEKKMIREKLFEVGEKVFLEKGIKKATIQEITKGAGISLGSFYNFFESKEKMFLELLDIYNARIFVVQNEELNRQIKEEKIDMERLVNVTFDTYRKMPGYMMVFERNEEYDYFINKISEEDRNSILHKDREVLGKRSGKGCSARRMRRRTCIHQAEQAQKGRQQQRKEQTTQRS